MQVKNIFGKQINVDGISREPEEIFEVDEDEQEIQNLLKHGYLEEFIVRKKKRKKEK